MTETTAPRPGGPDRSDDPANQARVRRVELIISVVLRGGVLLSVTIIAAGLVVMFAHHHDYAALTGHASYRTLISAHSPFPHTFSQLGRALAAGEGRGLVVLGVLVLILTPVLRVAVSVVSFAYERDRPMTAVTAFVLTALAGSFLLAGVLR